MLAQTVFTFLFVHHLASIEPDVVPVAIFDADPARPIALVTVVIRAAVWGLLKCCDLSWRELSKGYVYDVSLTIPRCESLALEIDSF